MSKKKKQLTTHPFHLLNPSSWPFKTSLSVFFTLIFLVFYIHFASFLFFLVFIANLFVTISYLLCWFGEIIRESTFFYQHTYLIQRGLRYGFILFLLSEIMFFFSFFWTFFHSSISPAIQIGAIWPPLGIIPICPYGFPLLNTIFLLTSSLTATIAHKRILYQSKFPGIVKNALATEKMQWHSSYNIFISIYLGVFFVMVQFFEYFEANFTFSDSIYGSIFFMATGFHGIHVLIGIIFLTIGYFRIRKFHFEFSFFFGLEAAIWYWHFVDVIWIFVFFWIYCWGS